jgi:F-type H+-transporting ATPase subunit b
MPGIMEDAHFWLLISFILFAVIVFRATKSKIIGMLDERISSITHSIKSAENLRIEAQELLAQYQRKHRDAVRDAERIIANAEKLAADIRRQAEKELDDTIALRERQLAERLERLKQNAIDEIREYAANLAIAATAQIISKNLDKAANEKLVDVAIKDVGRGLH